MVSPAYSPEVSFTVMSPSPELSTTVPVVPGLIHHPFTTVMSGIVTLMLSLTADLAIRRITTAGLGPAGRSVVIWGSAFRPAPGPTLRRNAPTTRSGSAARPTSTAPSVGCSSASTGRRRSGSRPSWSPGTGTSAGGSVPGTSCGADTATLGCRSPDCSRRSATCCGSTSMKRTSIHPHISELRPQASGRAGDQLSRF